MASFFTRIDPVKNISRFYLVDVTPTLLGEWSVLREWGRIGSPGTVQRRSFEREDDARRAEQRSIRRRARHGYQPTLDVVARRRDVFAADQSTRALCGAPKINYKSRRRAELPDQTFFDV